MSLKNIKIEGPSYPEVIPSTNKKIMIHPFKVKDEKVLLLAAESKDPKQMVSSLKSVITSCVDNVNVDDLAHFDLEYLFIKLRSVSVGESADIVVKCKECEGDNNVSVDLSQVKVKKVKNHTNIIRITDTLGFEMTYPDLENIAEINDEDPDSLIDMIASSVKTVYHGEETHTVTLADKKDLIDILNQLTSTQFKKVQEFFSTTPKLSHNIEFECEHCKAKNNQTLEGLASFF